MTAHLDDESRLAGLPELRPTLVRWAPPPDAPPHLAVGLDRLRAASRGETLLVVSGELAPAELLERVSDVRRLGATVFALDRGDRELEGIAHEALPVPQAEAPMTFDAAQHLVSAATAAPGPSARASGPARPAVPGRHAGAACAAGSPARSTPSPAPSPTDAAPASGRRVSRRIRGIAGLVRASAGSAGPAGSASSPSPSRLTDICRWRAADGGRRRSSCGCRTPAAPASGRTARSRCRGSWPRRRDPCRTARSGRTARLIRVSISRTTTPSAPIRIRSSSSSFLASRRIWLSSSL